MSPPLLYKPLTLQAVMELAAPHTWPASILPVLLGTALSCALQGAFDPLIFLSTLCAAVLLQAAVNTLNDYVDFVSGTDTLENSDDPTDAALIYHGFRPRCALILGFVFVLLAAIIGSYTVYRSGLTPLLIGIVGGVVVVAYSLGPAPISRLPLGEFMSGIVMGGGITLACYTAQSGDFSWMTLGKILWFSLPTMITIGLIMLTNNTCDIERDTQTGRNTLAVLLGRKKAKYFLTRYSTLSMLLVFLIVAYNFPRGIFLFPIAFIAFALVAAGWGKLPMTSAVRGPAMGGTLKICKIVNGYYLAMIIAHVVYILL